MIYWTEKDFVVELLREIADGNLPTEMSESTGICNIVETQCYNWEQDDIASEAFELAIEAYREEVYCTESFGYPVDGTPEDYQRVEDYFNSDGAARARVLRGGKRQLEASHIYFHSDKWKGDYGALREYFAGWCADWIEENL